MEDLGNLRNEYNREGLSRENLASDPIDLFGKWLKDAIDTEIIEPNAMTLATVDETGQPWQRTVLLKAYDSEGFVFFTNYDSRKATQLSHNPKASLLFPWLALERQVIVTGTTERISTAESLKYFASRPIGSRLGAWVSQQSSVISSRKFLESKLLEIKERFKDGKIPLPSFWGGYRVEPTGIEFWQGGPHRLHDRFLYSKKGDGSWNIDRLSP